jgi:hypothetical protein
MVHWAIDWDLSLFDRWITLLETAQAIVPYISMAKRQLVQSYALRLSAHYSETIMQLALVCDLGYSLRQRYLVSTRRV